MQLAELVVQGLFGKYDHKIAFPMTSEDETKPSVVILHGPNGIGKTTVLRMLNGMMALDFSIFRTVPFAAAHLDFNTGARLSVNRREDGALQVAFDGMDALLHHQHSGPLDPRAERTVDEFRRSFQRATESLTFEYVSASRMRPEVTLPSEHMRRRRSEMAYRMRYPEPLGESERHTILADLESRHSAPGTPLADNVQTFIREAQLDSPAYFRSNQPDLFIRVLDDLTNPAKPAMRTSEIAATLTTVHELEATHARLGLGRDQWDFARLMTLVVENGDALDERALTVLGTYAEFLDSRARARQLIAERLITFEEVMDQFLSGKQVRVDSKHGFTISSTEGERLSENQLSSGEYQLLYLMVAALTTRRRGTVIAIDEPELSMHIAWQSMLVPSLIRCASRAAPQLILATHSPDIAAGYPESMFELGTPSLGHAET
jgi:energy-coupling factor transporter ATP-binding protein EcfA2